MKNHPFRGGFYKRAPCSCKDLRGQMPRDDLDHLLGGEFALDILRASLDVGQPTPAGIDGVQFCHDARHVQSNELVVLADGVL